MDKPGTTFARTFPLIRPAIAEVLRLAVDAERSGQKRLSQASLRTNSNLGSVYVAAMPQYGLGTGLLTHNHLPTIFGAYVYECDPLLEHTGTQWLMHYYLSAAHGPGPTFWHDVVVAFFLSGDVLNRLSVAERIEKIHQRIEGQPIKPVYAREAATAFLGTYIRLDALGNLGILKPDGDNYLVLGPEPPPLWAVAYALLDYWEAQFGDQLNAGLNEFSGEEGISSIFMISRGRLNAMLEAMQAEGMLELQRIAAPYQVVLLQRDRHQVLKRLYGHQNTE